MAGPDVPERSSDPASAAGQLGSGTELAGYRIESPLGRGGMGVVYTAHDLALDRRVALKLLAPELAEDVHFRERFLRESRLAASLDHPAIIPIYDAGEVAGQLYIAMRLVEGTDLKRLLAEEGKLEPEHTFRLVDQLADALDAAHERGLVHRDVKPSNVLIDQRGHCYLADFGLSRRLADQTTGLGDGRSLGTVDYVAPEQIRGEELDGRADLYSLGCLLYECLAGRPPFGGGSDTAIVFAHLQEEPPVLPGLEPVMKRALAKEPDDRYQSGRELVAAAREALRGNARPRRRWLLATTVVLVAAGATVGGILASQDTNGRSRAANPPSISLTPNALNLIDARRHKLAGSVGLGNGVTVHSGTDIVFSGRSAWMLLPGQNGTGQRLLQIDVAARRATRVVRLPWTPAERIAVGGGMVWVREAPNLGKEVLGIDTRSGRTTRRFQFGGTTNVGIAYGDGSLWLVDGVDVVRVDPRSGHVLHRFQVEASWLVFADGAVWAAGTGGFVWKIDPVGNTTPAQIKLHPLLSDVAVGGGFVWVSIVGDDAVFKLSENDLSVQGTRQAGRDPERISIGGGGVWVANTAVGAVSVVGQASGRRTQFATATDPATAQFHEGLVWTAAARELPPLPPGEELRVSTPSPILDVDPVSRVLPWDEQLAYTTCANLLNYPDSAGPTGTRLRPEIAAAMPSVSRDGRTYTFRIRPGFRFSPPSNESVTAATFKHTIERTLSRFAQIWPNAPDIVGVAAFRAGKAAHISGISARGTLLSITLTRPAGDFLVRLAMPFFCPVPLSTPLDPTLARGPIASAGPYYVASVEPHRIVLLRNPNYAGDHPRGSARIVFTDNIPTPSAVKLADRGLVDYLPPDFSAGPLGPGSELDRRFGPASAAARAGRQRYFRHERPLLDTIVFNTRRPLFRDIRLRRAVEYALDRPALARAYFDAPADRVIPHSIPGYDPRPVSRIGGPDLLAARRLAGSGRHRAVLLAPCDASVLPAASIVRSDLAKIGITVAIVSPDVCFPQDVAKAFKHADLIIGTNLFRNPPERDPQPFVEDALTTAAWGSPLGPGPWDAPAFRKLVEQARALRGRARIAAYSHLVDELSRFAPLVVYGAFQYNEYFSPRVGCKVFQSFYQVVDLGALCVQGT
jgi:ABC-type transport system substrate-binding protein